MFADDIGGDVTMRAWVLHGINDIRLEEVPRPVLAETEVLVRVKAAGICGSDIPRIYQTGAHRHPLIPGHEFSGMVAEVGECVDAKWLGKRVGVFPLIPCRTCSPCKKSQFEMCLDYSYLGSRRDGAFTEYVAVPADNLIELPPEVSFEEAAMLEPMAVATHAMRHILPEKEETVAVCGLGTIGLLLVMLLKEAGVRNILAIGNKDFQKEMIRKLGVSDENYCDSKSMDVARWIMEHTESVGSDVSFECVGKNETVLQMIDTTAPGGRLCLLGNPYSDMQLEKSVYWKILRNQLTITGTWNSSFMHDETDDWNYVLNRLAEKSISPTELITHRLSLEELDKGFCVMRDKTDDYVKVMGVW